MVTLVSLQYEWEEEDPCGFLTDLLAGYQAAEQSRPLSPGLGPHFPVPSQEGCLVAVCPHLGGRVGGIHGQSPFTPASQEAALSQSSSVSPPCPCQAHVTIPWAESPHPGAQVQFPSLTFHLTCSLLLRRHITEGQISVPGGDH